MMLFTALKASFPTECRLLEKFRILKNVQYGLIRAVSCELCRECCFSCWAWVWVGLLAVCRAWLHNIQQGEGADVDVGSSTISGLSTNKKRKKKTLV